MMKNEQVQEMLLFEAINKRDIEGVKQLLASDINREIVNENNQTSLHLAARTGNLDITKLLLEKKPQKLNLSQFMTQRDKDGKTALHFAAEACAVGVIKYLRFKSKHQLDKIKDNKEFSALDCIRSMRTMRKMGDKKFSTEEIKKMDDTIKALISNPKLEKEIAKLQEFIQEENLVGVKELIAKNPELLESRNEYTNTPLFEAIYSEKFAIANYLLEAGADINARCFEGKTPLHRAVWVKNKEMVLELIRRGAKLEVLNDHEATPLLDAVGIDKNSEIIEILLKQGAAFSVCNAVGRNIIHVAAEGNCSENIQYLFEKINDKEIFEQTDGFGRRPLHLAAERTHIETIQVLLKLGCRIDAQDEYGRTAFHLAAEKNHVKVLQCLSKLGCKMNTPDKYMRTPLHMAAAAGAVDTVEYLLNVGVDLEALDNKNRTPLHLAARNGQLEIIKYLIKKGADFSKKDSKERTPLVVAKTHQGLYKNQTEFQEACSWLSGIKKWNSQTKYSDAPQGFHYQLRTTQTPRAPSRADTVQSWRPKKP